MNTMLTKVHRLLEGDRHDPDLPECDSMSLRLEKFVRIGDNTKKDEIDAVVSKRTGRIPFFEPKDAVSFTAKLGGRLIVNQACGILENSGLCIHPHYNAPYIPGSAVKGCARHAAWQIWNDAEEGEVKVNSAKEVAEIFGYPTGDEGLDDYLASKCGYGAAQSGKVAFLAAVPEGTTMLAVDILTPHGRNDWTDPVPSVFPVVEKGSSFKFTVLPTNFGDASSVILRDRAVAFLKMALRNNGIGAKTNAGYGRFQLEGVDGGSGSLLVNLHFASPAFLRGADDRDVNLRISTLRGLLRWWWRWLYRSYLSETDVRALETRIWGGASSSSTASCIALSFAREPNVIATRMFVKPSRRDRVPRPGVAYLSYGMDEISHGDRRQRRIVEVSPKHKWQLQIDLNPHSSGLSAWQLSIHARLAVWALCSFGGVGSRSRKGFGSLCSDVTYDLENVFADMLVSLDGLPYEKLDEPTVAYAWLNSLQGTIATNENDAWVVLDRIGSALQGVASEYKHDPDKAVLGLPRKIHGPKREPMQHQLGHRHSPPMQLRADSRCVNGRFAAPLFVHLEDGVDGITVNLTACPSDMVRNIEVSTDLLQACIDAIVAEFAK